MGRSGFWLEEHGLDLATDKTEITLLTWRRGPTIIPLQVGAERVFTKNAVKYLGVRLDSKLSYWEQIKYAADP